MTVLSTMVGRGIRVIGLMAWTTYAVAVASLMVARDIVAPSARLVPGVLIVPLRARTTAEIAVLAGLITLTPGTMVVRIDPKRESVWVHTMYASDPEAARREIVDLESRILRTLRYPNQAVST